jgi:hypothetical protein
MDLVRAQDRGLCGRDDPVLLQAATAEGRLMLTCDTDFLALHASWQAAGQRHAGIVYWHQDKYPVGEAIRRILHYARHTAPADAANAVKYL